MTPGSLREYAAAARERYARAGRGDKGRILDEFCRTTGCQRKAAVRLLRRPPTAGGGRRRAARNGLEVARALKRAREAADRPCSKRLAPFLAELVPALERHGELAVAPGVRDAPTG